MSEDMATRKGTRRAMGTLVIFSLMFIGGILVVASSTLAWSLSDIPEQVNSALFAGGNLFAAKMLLSASVLASIALAMAAGKQPMLPMMVVLVATMGALIAIGWLDVWLMVMVGLLIAGMFGKRMADIYSGAGGDTGG